MINCIYSRSAVVALARSFLVITALLLFGCGGSGGSQKVGNGGAGAQNVNISDAASDCLIAPDDPEPPGEGDGGGSGDTNGDPDPPPDPPPNGDPTTGISFHWVINNIPFNPPAFVPSPGPANHPARNQISRLQLTHELALVLYRRVLPGSAVSLLEVAIWNDPLVCQVQPGPGLPIPSQVIPNLDLVISGGRMLTMFPNLATWKPVTQGKRYRFQLTNPDWAKIADGAGHAWPFLVTTDVIDPVATDLLPLFPPNPGSIWTAVDPNYPSRDPSQINELTTGGSYFPATGDPWGVMGADVQYTPTTGYQPDWYWCHLGAYYARNDINDILYVAPTVYRQAARPCHYYGFNGSSSEYWFNMSRPAKWSTNYLGRVPTGSNELFIAPINDTHGWYGYDHQHASARRVSEYAMATGSPFAWNLTLYYGELAKAMMRTIDPKPFGPGFDNTPRGYLGWLEIAYRASLLNPAFDMTPCINSMENFFEFGHIQPFGKAWGIPQVMWALVNDKWIPGHYAAASFEDLRAVPISIKVGQAFNRPKLIQSALEKCEWYTTAGYTSGAEGKGIGIKRIVDPLDPSVFVDADLSGYNRVSALGLKLTSEYLVSNPTAGFNGPLYKSVSDAIVAEAKPQLSWKLDLSAWMMWP
ncbi:MAG: hypothetical protein ACKVS6_01760 [Planctomycetota bacterium]